MENIYRIRSLCWSLACLFLVSGCSTTVVTRAQLQYASGDAASALQTLGDGSEIRSRDMLLYWLEKGLILHETGDYEGSAKALLSAVTYLEENDYISVRGEASALLANDWIRNYKGEYSEQLWVHTYLMMNFLSLGRYDSAAVEARRALERIDSKKDVLLDDYFTRALIGLSFEAAGQINSAYIEYSKLADQLSQSNLLQTKLYRFAKSLGFAEDARRYKGSLTDSERQAEPGYAEVFLFLAGGQLPQKISGSLVTDFNERIAFPRYLPAQGFVPDVAVSVDGVPCDCAPIRSNLGGLARESLNSRGIALTARLIARNVAKDSLADNIAKKDEVAAEIVRVLLFVLEEADTRGWRSLPGHLAVYRIPLSDSSRELLIESASAAPLKIDVSEMREGERRFISIRDGFSISGRDLPAL